MEPEEDHTYRAAQLFKDEFFAFDVNYPDVSKSANSRYFDVTYDFSEKSVGLRYYSPVSNLPDRFLEVCYTLKKAESVLRTVASKHPEEFSVDDMLGTVKLFFHVMREATVIEGPVTQSDKSCSICDSLDVDDFVFYLFPAIPGTPLVEACLSLTWDYGCSGSRSAMGDVRSVGHEAMDMLEHILELASSDFEDNVRSAISALSREL